MARDERTKLILNEKEISRLKESTIALYGIGGVGGVVLECLARTGVGHIHVVDNDKIEESNFNRQILATNDVLGMSKTNAAKIRVSSISEDIKYTFSNEFVLKDNVESSLTVDNTLIKPDYIIDCVDTVTAKIALVEYSKNNNINIISCMGTGNKINPSMLEVSDIYDTSVCPLCKVMRTELRKRQISSLKVVYSKEVPVKQSTGAVGSVAFVPNAAGILIACEVVKDLIGR